MFDKKNFITLLLNHTYITKKPIHLMKNILCDSRSFCLPDEGEAANDNESERAQANGREFGFVVQHIVVEIQAFVQRD